jgi:hypothetical protein
MERNSDIGTNIRDSYQLSTCIEQDGVIYLLRDDGNKNSGMAADFKITITKIGE